MPILIAEDNPVNQLLIREFCRAGGFPVQAVEDGEAAVRAAEEADYRLVLMDIHMPRLNGIEATRRIRAINSHRGRVPIIAVTADVTPDTRFACHEAGMNDIITKPLTLTAFLAKVKEWQAQHPNN